jgi:hypothetical protein
MKTLFKMKDLISFGEYLLSKKRTDLISSNWDVGDSVTLEERLRQIYDADIQNWKYWNKIK